MWDMTDWTVPNVSMAGVADGGTLPDLAQRRVAGKPFICTEYNAPAPNTHSSEAFLLLNAYAALQDWDGVFVFAYSHRHDDWDTQYMTSFFDVDQHPAKMVTFPAAVAMFLRGDVSMARRAATVPVSWEAAIDASLRAGSWWGMGEFGAARMLPLQSRVELDPGGQAAVAGVANPGADKVTVSDTGELTWDADMGRVLVNTPRSKAYIGNVTGEAIRLGGVTIEPRANMQNWAAITVTDMTRAGMPRDILITATGYTENTGMRWTSAARDSVGANFGKAPSLVEGIPARITLPAGAVGAQAWALDGRGERKYPVQVTRTPGGVAVEIGPQYQTLWYEVELPRSR